MPLTLLHTLYPFYNQIAVQFIFFLSTSFSCFTSIKYPVPLLFLLLNYFLFSSSKYKPSKRKRERNFFLSIYNGRKWGICRYEKSIAITITKIQYKPEVKFFATYFSFSYLLLCLFWVNFCLLSCFVDWYLPISFSEKISLLCKWVWLIQASLIDGKKGTKLYLFIILSDYPYFLIKFYYFFMRLKLS